MDKDGKLILFSAPSGSGKTTIVHRMLPLFPQLQFSVSATSRPRREGETDGVDYYFLTIEKFKGLCRENRFLEWEEVYANQFYGTLLSELDRIWSLGKHVLFDVDVKGGINIKRKFPEKTLAIFVQPPSIEELRNRLVKRGSETEESLAKRVGKAKEELAFAPLFDKVIVNENLEDAVEEARNAIAEFLSCRNGKPE